MFTQQCGILAPRRGFENVTEILSHDGRGGGIHMKIDFAPRQDHQRPDLVDPMNMVCVRMGQQNGVEPFDAEPKHLFAEIRRHVDEDLSFGAAFAGALDQQRTAPAAVFRVVGIAGAPALAGPGNPSGRSAAQNGEGKAHAASASATGGGILLKRRNVLALVSLAIVSIETPFTSASVFAVAATKAGSFRLPR